MSREGFVVSELSQGHRIGGKGDLLVSIPQSHCYRRSGHGAPDVDVVGSGCFPKSSVIGGNRLSQVIVGLFVFAPDIQHGFRTNHENAYTGGQTSKRKIGPSKTAN